MAIQPEVVEQLFEAALALKPTEREAFLDQVCSHDPELRRTSKSCWPRMQMPAAFLSTRHLIFLASR